MNRKMAAIALAGLLGSCSLITLAAEKQTAGSAVPPTALPGANQAQGAGSKEDKASKKGEEASGGNSGADADAMEKDTAPSGGQKDDGTTQPGSSGG